MEHKVTLNDYDLTCPKITDLPIDVMIYFFKYLTPSERLRTITVCHAWLQLVNEFFSKDHCLVLTEKMNFSADGPLYKTFSDRLETTKHFRSFQHLIFKSIPRDVHNFIDLVMSEVKSLIIEHEDNFGRRSDWYHMNLYSKMPNLESLEVPSSNFLCDLSSSTNLKTIKLKSNFYDLKILKYCRETKTIKSLTAGSIAIMKKEIDDESLMFFMEPNTKELLKQIIGSETYGSMTLESNFNFCSETKFSVDDVSGMEIQSFEKPLSPNILSKFQNLKKLKFLEINPLVERVEYFGITHLELDGYLTVGSPHFDKLPQSFPDLLSLSITNYIFLKDYDFSIICQFMQNLKELVLKGYIGISVEAILDTNQYSLKDLRLLEKLVIGSVETTYETNGNHQWPDLPNLKKLKLFGEGFQFFDQIFYAQIAQNSPKITDITINFQNDTTSYSSFYKFLPLIEQLQLTQLNLPGEGSKLNALEEFESNTELVRKVLEHCKHLQEITITDDVGFSLEQKKLLFSRIPSLKKVESNVFEESLYDDGFVYACNDSDEYDDQDD